jgi:hypothetical protein
LKCLSAKPPLSNAPQFDQIEARSDEDEVNESSAVCDDSEMQELLGIADWPSVAVGIDKRNVTSMLQTSRLALFTLKTDRFAHAAAAQCMGDSVAAVQ